MVHDSEQVLMFTNNFQVRLPPQLLPSKQAGFD